MSPPEKPEPGTAADAAAGAVPPPAEPVPETPPSPPPTLEEDLIRLESMDWFRACLVRVRKGRHPDPEIEALLQRRLNLPRADFQGPYAVRLLSTLAWVLTFCSLAWIFLWAVGSLAGFDQFVWMVSGLMTTLLAVLLGLAISQPIVFVDEQALQHAALEELTRLKAMSGLAKDAQIETPRKPPASAP